MPRETPDARETILLPFKCKVCTECHVHPLTRRCIYQGPYGGYIGANNEEDCNQPNFIDGVVPYSK